MLKTALTLGLATAGAFALAGCADYSDPYYAGNDPYYGTYPAGPTGPYGPGPYRGYGAPPPPPGTVVRVMGCPARGVESGCVTVRDQSGMAWDVSGAGPRPDPYGRYAVEITGRVSHTGGYCMAGPRLENVEWRYTGVRCP